MWSGPWISLFDILRNRPVGQLDHARVLGSFAAPTHVVARDPDESVLRRAVDPGLDGPRRCVARGVGNQLVERVRPVGQRTVDLARHQPCRGVLRLCDRVEVELACVHDTMVVHMDTRGQTRVCTTQCSTHGHRAGGRGCTWALHIVRCTPYKPHVHCRRAVPNPLTGRPPPPGGCGGPPGAVTDLVPTTDGRRPVRWCT